MNNQDSEKYLEQKLCKFVRDFGGMAIKQTSQFHRGLPDRLIILPNGRVDWVELKTKGKHPTKLQTMTHDELRALGQNVITISSYQELNEYFETI